jgi:hypothetical protein
VLEASPEKNLFSTGEGAKMLREVVFLAILLIDARSRLRITVNKVTVNAPLQS